jgi:hypothetical protein
MHCEAKRLQKPSLTVLLWLQVRLVKALVFMKALCESETSTFGTEMPIAPQRLGFRGAIECNTVA